MVKHDLESSPLWTIRQQVSTDGWKMLKPSEPVPFEVAITAGKKGEEARKALKDDPSLTPSEIAKRFDVTDRYARRIVAGTKAEQNQDPTYMNHGGKRDEQADHSPVDRNYGNSRDGIIARLRRDGRSELADQVDAFAKSARQAAIEAGFKVPESQLRF